MQVRHHPARDLEQLFALLQDPARDDRYTVAWIDSMSGGNKQGRGVVMCGHHAAVDEVSADFKLPTQRSRAIPFNLPSWVLNGASISAFNALYYRCEGRKQQPFLSGQESFFYPLDAIGHWNRLYGKRGFVQYQCVIPEASAFDGVRELLQELARSRYPSFLAVLKRLGAQGRGMLSFPMAGYTLALDIPVRDAGTLALLDALDQIVMRHSGRVYLAKDARLAADAFRVMYPRYAEWLKIKQALDPNNVFSSSLSRRLRMGGMS